LKDWSNEVSLEYGINTIPQSILIAPDGTIVDHIADTDALEKKTG